MVTHDNELAKKNRPRTTNAQGTVNHGCVEIGNSMKQNVFFRELRTLSHRAIVILGSIALGVAAITSVHALADSIREGIRLESRPMIAGDLVARSMHPFPEKMDGLDRGNISAKRRHFPYENIRNDDNGI